MALDECGLGQVFSSLPQESIESLSSFRMEVNLLRAQAGQEAINVEEALQYLRPNQFHSAKSLDIYKNYQKHRETYHLSSLRPYRDPLSSAIGTKKMEIVGSKDSEGYPIVLFTVSRHETFKSDHKTDMQLLFYTLDQVAASAIAQEKGVVFIVDFRDSQLSDIRYTSSVLSVLKDGYPLHTKVVYVVSTKRLNKMINGLQRMLKHDSKVKFIDFSELGSHFSPEQLPLSLGGTFVPRMNSPTRRQFETKDDFSVMSPNHSSRPTRLERRGSDGSQTFRRVADVPHPSSGGGKSVNKLLELFEGGSHEPPQASNKPLSQASNKPLTSSSSQASNKPLSPPSSQASNKPLSQASNKPLTSSSSQASNKPLSPSSSQASNKPLSPPSSQASNKPLSQASNKPLTSSSSQASNKLLAPLSPAKARPVPPPKKLMAQQSTELQVPPSTQHQVALKKFQHHGNEGDTALGRNKVPILPPNGRPNFTKSSSSESKQFGRLNPPVRVKEGASNAPVHTKEGASNAPVHSKEGGKLKEGNSNTPGSRGVKDGSNPSTADVGKGSNVFAKKQAFGSGVMKKIGIFNSTSEDSKEDTAATGLSASCVFNSSKQQDDLPERRRAGSAGKATPSKIKGEGPNSSGNSRIPVQPPPYAGKMIPADLASSSSSSSASSAQTPKKPRSYENVSPSQNKPPSQPLSQESLDYENLSFTNRDSDVYENIGIGFAGPGDHMAGSLPPLPLGRQPVQPGRMTYENVEIGKSPVKGNKVKIEKMVTVEEDDDMLFGKEGPPGLQETIYENFGPDKGNRLMTIEELAAHVENLGKNGLSTEYYRVRNDPITGAHTACRLPCNTPKNRYKDVICYDETRVHLKPRASQEGSDYIHANYVDGFKKPKAFILTQGPKDKTVVDFWRMIWEMQVVVIVMVTKCVEIGKKKCAQYWPESDTGSVKHGHYNITVTTVQTCDGYDLRTLQLTFKGTERTIMHFQFLAWPDYGIPTSGSSILALIFAVREAQQKLSRGGGQPIVVHCSAGVGRSGAFCSIDNCICEVDEQKKVNLQAVVRKMRKQRAFSVQTEEQYEFCYRTLLEYARGR